MAHMRNTSMTTLTTSFTLLSLLLLLVFAALYADVARAQEEGEISLPYCRREQADSPR